MRNVVDGTGVMYSLIGSVCVCVCVYTVVGPLSVCVAPLTVCL